MSEIQDLQEQCVKVNSLFKKLGKLKEQFEDLKERIDCTDKELKLEEKIYKRTLNEYNDLPETKLKGGTT